jgi:hypothetical protein
VSWHLQSLSGADSRATSIRLKRQAWVSRIRKVRTRTELQKLPNVGIWINDGDDIQYRNWRSHVKGKLSLLLYFQRSASDIFSKM